MISDFCAVDNSRLKCKNPERYIKCVLVNISSLQWAPNIYNSHCVHASKVSRPCLRHNAQTHIRNIQLHYHCCLYSINISITNNKDKNEMFLCYNHGFHYIFGFIGHSPIHPTVQIWNIWSRSLFFFLIFILSVIWLQSNLNVVCFYLFFVGHCTMCLHRRLYECSMQSMTSMISRSRIENLLIGGWNVYTMMNWNDIDINAMMNSCILLVNFVLLSTFELGAMQCARDLAVLCKFITDSIRIIFVVRLQMMRTTIDVKCYDIGQEGGHWPYTNCGYQCVCSGRFICIRIGIEYILQNMFAVWFFVW